MNLEVQQFVEALTDLLRRQMSDLADDLARNTCSTIEDYRHVCGKIQGLWDADNHIKALAKLIEDQDDE